MNAAVQAVRLVGSRADGRAHDLSDWDFVVVTEEFESVASDLHGLVATLRPLGEQWDRYSSHACYMLMLAGPTKIDLLFPSEHRSWSPPWTPSPETLEAIDLHFWDWILWLEQKRRGGKGELLRKNLGDMHELMLGPMAVASEPKTVSAAIGAYVKARDELEERFGVSVPRDLEHEVRLLVERAS
jgi:Nucleotidyltransferase domain